ncbi:helix-turn-helix transcriptional regulator [Enterococcus asini]|uniref:Helix-turn-helix transcriptional regulator n=1 Tax=Enterococcus asini TaxID=57732 RepID=A0AAW8TS72_9ENTE|nr:helix-turn-helix transcriptional regulator [Enterococcus asini]MDT2809156.1 helix-turn-helix transcriptional regulator [Enterococcus asini]
MLLDRIKELANERKMTIAELERKVDFGQGSISKWAKQSPSSERLKIVADFFDVSTDYLLDRTDIRKPADSTEDPVEAMLKTVMSSDGKPLTENDRNILRGIIEAYLKNKE